MDRILHISDTHLGRWQYKNDQRQQDYSDAFEKGINVAIDEDVDAVIHTGDLFDDPNPHSSTLNDAFDIIGSLEAHEIPFYAIVGNHERKRKAQWMDLIEKLDIAHRLGANPTRIGETEVYGVDSIRKTRWDAVESFELNEPESEETFKLVCMHELLYPPVPEHIYEKSSSVYATQDALSKINIDVDGVALGDYHERCRSDCRGVPFFYPGSTEKTAKDEPDIKSVDILEIEDGNIRRDKKHIETREFKTVEITIVDGMDSSDMNKKLSEYEVDGVVLEVVLDGSTNTTFTTQQIREIGVRKGALVVDVVDNRETEADHLSVEEASETVEDIESVIDEQINDLELSETASEVESLVRDTGEVDSLSAVEQRARDTVEKQSPEADAGDSE
jgi:DNA repair exonuclease SbcCD nuclease subunit